MRSFPVPFSVDESEDVFMGDDELFTCLDFEEDFFDDEEAWVEDVWRGDYVMDVYDFIDPDA